MSQLYARVFVKILDSSIAEDYRMRHVFEDFLKLADYKTGIVDVTRQALSRKLNIPLDVLNAEIEKLEAPDPASHDPAFEGRRLLRLDDHRDWGWKIANWEKYEAIKKSAESNLRVARHRERLKALQEAHPATESKRFTPPSLEEVKLQAGKVGLSEVEALKFHAFYESNGWRVGKNVMKNWVSAMAGWKIRNQTNEGNKPNREQRVDRSIGTTNEGTAHLFEGLGKVARPGIPQ